MDGKKSRRICSSPPPVRLQQHIGKDNTQFMAQKKLTKLSAWGKGKETTMGWQRRVCPRNVPLKKRHTTPQETQLQD